MFFPIKDYNPTRRTAYLTILLIALNCLVFIYQGFLTNINENVIKYAMFPAEITHFKGIEEPLAYKEGRREGEYYRENIYREVSPIGSLFTSIFMHASLWHLLGNMLFLWIFGNNIEDHLGRVKFIIFYLLCGIGASLAHALFNFNSLDPVIGASGAVSGIMGAYLILYPKAKVKTLVFFFFIITTIDLPAFVFLIIWFIFQFSYAGAGSYVAWLAHVGGFLIGILLIKLMGSKPKPVVEIIDDDDDDDEDDRIHRFYQ